MKKMVLVILAGILLMVSVSSYAEYKDYRLTEGDMSSDGLWGYCALDAHNTVVLARTINGKGWHLTWYRDGQMYRDISGTDKDLDMMPHLEGRDGDTLFLSQKKQISSSEMSYMKWTEDGVTEIPVSEIAGHGIDNPAAVKGENGWSIRYNGKETLLPASFPDEGESVMECIAGGEDVFLVKTTQEENGWAHYLSCVDHGSIKYKVKLPDHGYFQAADGKGGFFTTEEGPSGDYSPVRLLHYDAYGKADRVMQLTGDRVVLSFENAKLNENTGLCTLYGYAVANSRKVYTVFALTLDADLKGYTLDMRNIDPEYQEYAPSVSMAPDGAAYVIIHDMRNKKKLRPVMIPFSMLDETKETHGLEFR